MELEHARAEDITRGEVDGEPRVARPASRGPMNSFWVPMNYSSISRTSTSQASHDLQTALNTIRNSSRSTTTTIVNNGSSSTVSAGGRSRAPLLRRKSYTIEPSAEEEKRAKAHRRRTWDAEQVCYQGGLLYSVL